jgi:RND family efflux transporter MFP subunit
MDGAKNWAKFAALPALLLSVSVLAEAQPLATVVVGMNAVADAVVVEGRVEAVVQATVAARVPGRILEVRVDAGQRVNRGDILMRLDAREATEAAAAARAGAIEAKANFERTRQLQRENFVSQSAVDRARASFDAAQAQADAARAGASHASLAAPIAGLVSKRHADAGEMATPGLPLVTIIDPDQLRVTAHVPQGRLAALTGARSAVVEFPEQGVRLRSELVQVLPTVDAATHVAEVRVGLPAGQTGLFPGMAARVSLLLGEASRLTVPRRAVLRRGELASVYVVAANGSLSLRQIRLGPNLADDVVEVLAGLRAGETIAADPVAAGIALKQPAAR